MAHVSTELDGFLLLSFAGGMWETLGFYLTFEAAQDRIEQQFRSDVVVPQTIVGMMSGHVKPPERILLLIPVKGARVYSSHNEG